MNIQKYLRFPKCCININDNIKLEMGTFIFVCPSTMKVSLFLPMAPGVSLSSCSAGHSAATQGDSSSCPLPGVASKHKKSGAPGTIGGKSGTFAVLGCVSGRSSPRRWTLTRSSRDRDIDIHLSSSLFQTKINVLLDKPGSHVARVHFNITSPTSVRV